MWFDKLFGFKEQSPDQVRSNLVLRDNKLISLVNQREFTAGELEIQTLDDFRKLSLLDSDDNNCLQLSQIVADVQELHKDIDNEHALFQAASQFNLLEMIGPDILPESGVSRYEYDYTQGPACAIACGAGTVYRNYFVNVNGEIGQTHSNQINCLSKIGKELNNEELNLWKMSNGYALATADGLVQINKHIDELSDDGYENLKCKLEVGVQWNAEVTISETKHLVSQIYCSALPVRYSGMETKSWKSFAKLILDATYEATFYAGLRNYNESGCNKMYLTMVGGGAFGNNEEWIIDAIAKSVQKFRNVPLDVRFVSHRNLNINLQKFIEKMS